MDALRRKTCGAPRTVKPCGPVPPMQGTTPGSRARGDGGKKAGSPGRSRSSRKTIAQGVPCDFGVPVLSLRASLLFCA
jgi:hypothetical protein